MNSALNKVPPAKEYYIFDANFFITVQQINPPKFFERFRQAKEELGWDFFISEQVFKEIKHIYYSEKNSEIFKKCITIQAIDPIKVQEIKRNDPAKRLPQDSDLSLVLLAKKLKSIDKTGFIVTDDFKLSEFAEKSQIKVLSCSAFVLKVANNIRDQLSKRFFITLRKQVQQAEIEYALDRKDIYPIHQKLSWLIERAINVSEEKVIFQEEVKECYDESNAEERIQRELWLAQRILMGEKLHKPQNTEMEYLYPLLERITEIRKDLKKAQQFLVHNQSFQAMELLKEMNHSLINLYFLEKAKFITHHTPELLIGNELARVNFLHALCSVQVGAIPEAKQFFNDTVMFGLIARKKNLILMSLLLTALIHVFDNHWKAALEQYALVAEVAKKFEDEQIWLKSLLGQSIVQFISGAHHEAMKNLEPIQKLFQKNPRKTPIILEEFGDIYYALGMPDHALIIYQEALEYQLEEKIPPTTLIEKIRKCFLIQGIREPKTTKEFSEFMDALHYLDGKFFDQYDETMVKVFEINKLLYEPFPIFTKKQQKLMELKITGLTEWLDVIDLEIDEENKTVLIIYSPQLGLFGIQIGVSSLIFPIPENYKVRFKRDSQIISIQQPNPKQQEKYLIRAIIQIDNDFALEIERQMPNFYEILTKA